MRKHYIHITPKGLRALTNNDVSLRRHVIMLRVINKPILLTEAFRQVRLQREVSFTDSQLADDVVTLRQKGFLKVYQS